MTTNLLRRSFRVLLLNPNSSHSMTKGMEKAVRHLDLPDSLELYTYTAPEPSPASINDDNDMKLSAEVVVSDLAKHNHADQYDAILVACYSVHPLVEELSHLHPNIIVMGIFEASVLSSLSLMKPYGESWGIVTTGKFWEGHLTKGVLAYSGQQEHEAGNAKFAGVFSTGLNAGDFHGDIPPEVIRDKLREATGKLLSKSRVSCVVMGCAGMAGLEEIIRSTAVEKFGEEKGNSLYIIDGVKAGVGLVLEALRSKRLFQGH